MALQGSSDFEEKLERVFGRDAVVEKGIHLSLGPWGVPRFIEEYLIMRECAGLSATSCAKRVSSVLRRFRPEPSEKNLKLDQLMSDGELTLMDFFTVTTDIRKGVHRLSIPCLDLKKAMVHPRVLRKHENLLRNGVWGMGRLLYDPKLSFGAKDSDPVSLVELVPYQISSLDISEFQDARGNFSDEEWLDLLIKSLGLNPEAYKEEQKLYLLARLIPLAEANVNMMEFGPRATGKTFLYRNISPLVRIVSGGVISPAQLFYHKVHGNVGLIGVMDVVVFDEIQYLKFSGAEEILGKLKDYMASGHFERGAKQAASGCSLVFMGNVDWDVNDGLDIDRTIPRFAKDPAFMDRIHGMIPGWKLPKITGEEHLAKGKGLALDYLGSVLHELRMMNFREEVKGLVDIVGNPSIRDQQAVIRLLSGFLKVLYPDMNFDGSLLPKVVQMVEEMRGIVRNWLAAKLPHEYGEEFEVVLLS